MAGMQLLAVLSQGKFTSYFAGKDSPLFSSDSTDGNTENEVISSVIDHSSESARLIVVASNSFADDNILRTLSSVNGSQHLAPIDMLSNSVEWSLEDQGLLSIRSRGHFNRTLPPMDNNTIQLWEYLNYGLALLMLLVIFIFRKWQDKTQLEQYTLLLNGGSRA